MKGFGKRLRDLRESKNMTQEEFGVEVDLARTTIASLENERQEPTLKLINRLKTKYGISYDYLFDGIDSVTPERVKELEAEIVRLKESMIRNADALDISHDHIRMLKERLAKYEK